MLLAARMLNSVLSVNAFEWAQQVEFTAGDTVDVYFQLVDLTMDKAVNRFSPAGRRYMPAAGATLTVKLDNIDDNVSVTRAATQPFANDGSIWKVSIVATDVISGTCALVLTLNESAKITRGRVEAAVLIHNPNAL